jgi:hypothetical protein
VTEHVPRRSIAFLLPFVFVVVAASTVMGNPPPGFYNRWRRGADEALVIEVTSVKTNGSDGSFLVDVRAKVLAVERSKSKLKPGSSIAIRHFYEDPKVVRGTGPGSPQLLKKGQICPAFLNKSSDDNVYSAAASRETFCMTPEYVPEDE